ncbi:MMPL family transporter [Thermodesulfobacteriota bacterium]
MLKNFLKRFSFREIFEYMLRRPMAVILAILLITLFFAWQTPQLSFKTSIYDLVIENLPETERYQKFKDVFGSDEIIRVVIKSKNVFDPVTFKKIEQLAETASKIKGIRRIIGLPGIRKAVDVSGKWRLDEFADVLDEVDLFRKNLFSTDRKTTALTLVLADGADPESVIRSVEEMMGNTSKELTLYQIGMPLVSQALAMLTEKDFFTLPPITALIIAVVLFVLYRRFLYLILPLTCVSFALVWTFGFMALTRIPLSMLTMIVPVFLIAVGTAYCLHIVAEYLIQVQRAGSPKDAAISTFSVISVPTILAVFTTMIGLGSLLVNRIPTIREFAVFSCVGIFSFMIILFTFLPAAMALIPLPEKKEEEKPDTLPIIDRFLEWIVRLNLDYQRFTLPIIGVFVIFCVIGIFQMRVETNPVGYFKKDTSISRNFHDIYKDLSGSFPINVVMESPNEDYFEDPKHIAGIARLQKFIETLPGVDKTISFADYMQLVNYASNRFEPKYYALPQEGFEVRMLINSYRIMLGEDMLARFMKPDFSGTNILLLTHISSSRDFLDTRDKILDYAEKNFSKDLRWDVTGFGMVISESSHQLTAGQVKSLSITMILVFAIMFLLFLSSKVGFIAIVPNLFPIIINFGIMGWFGVELSMVTSLIASIAIGLAVDDTIHYLVRFNREFKKDLDDKRALRETIMHMGRPIIFTTLTISAGFSILAFSSFKPTAIFGVMMVITMLSALVGDLILLPSLMQRVEIVTLWDLVRLKLGEEPRHGIQLFNGLSRTEVHYIIMAGTLKNIEAGDVLFRKGDPSDSMFAVISGSMDVIDPMSDDEDQPLDIQKRIARLEAGDVLGEMGLLRSAPRSATIVAAESGEYLQINLKMIKRLQWLYPPTAQKFFFNLMTILCDRLEAATQCITEGSILDDITGWYNRKGFLNVIETEVHRSRRYKENLSLCLMEIDIEFADPQMQYDLKERNFRSLGETLNCLIRKSDALGRLDDQTFALLMPQTSAQQAEPVCKRLKELLLAKRLETDGIRLKVSLGVSGLNYDAEEFAEDLLAKSNEALQGAMKS